MPTPDIRSEKFPGHSEREEQARLALDAVRRNGPEAVREETLRMKCELVRLYGWEGYQLVMAKMESDLARLSEQ